MEHATNEGLVYVILDGNTSSAPCTWPPPDSTCPLSDTRTYNAPLRGVRRLAERGFALLTGRRCAQRHFTTSPRKIGNIVKAALTLTHFEPGRPN